MFLSSSYMCKVLIIIDWVDGWQYVLFMVIVIIQKPDMTCTGLELEAYISIQKVC